MKGIDGGFIADPDTIVERLEQADFRISGVLKVKMRSKIHSMLYDQYLKERLKNRAGFACGFRTFGVVVVKPLLVLALITIIVFISDAQDSPKAVLVDKFRIVSCENLMVRVEQLGLKLAESPSSSGYLIVYGGGKNSVRADYYAEFIHRILIGRVERDFNVIININRNSDQEPIRAEFFLVAPGVDFAKPGVQFVARTPFKVDRKLLFGTQTIDPCTNYLLNGFIRTLKSNPDSSGFVVIVNEAKNRRSKSTREWLKVFSDAGIPKHRYRLFFRNEKMVTGFRNNDIEYWLVPGK